MKSTYFSKNSGSGMNVFLLPCIGGNVDIVLGGWLVPSIFLLFGVIICCLSQHFAVNLVVM